MDNTNQNDIFKTDDIDLSAYLLSMGASFIDTEEESPGHFEFVFSEPNKCRLLKRDFLNNTPAPVLSLFSKREMLLTQIKTKRGDRSRKT